MITYHDAFAEANNYLDDANLPVVITLHGRFSGAGISVSKHENFSKLEMRPRA